MLKVWSSCEFLTICCVWLFELNLGDKAKDKLEKSMVADNESGKSVESEVRTSSGMFLNKAQVSLILIANFVLDL